MSWSWEKKEEGCNYIIILRKKILLKSIFFYNVLNSVGVCCNVCLTIADSVHLGSFFLLLS